MPTSIVIAGSDNGSSWVVLASVVYKSQSASATQTVELEASSKKYFRFTATNNGGSSVDFPEITLYGKEFLYTGSFFKPANNTDVLITDNVEVYESILREHGACGAFFVDPWSHKVRLPDWRNAYPLYTGISRDSGLSVPGYPGDTIPAGLPDITGSFTAKTYESAELPTGCFEEVWSDIGVTPSGLNKDRNTTVEFNASRSSSIYGNSDTVRPLSVSAVWCIQVFNAATDLSEQESAQLASQMQMKAQTDFANVGMPVQSFINKSVAWGTPDYSAGVAVSHPTSGAPFTAPCGGIFCECFYYSSDTSSALYINGATTGIVVTTGGSYRNNRQSTIIPLAKGDTIYWSTTATTIYGIAFYPLKGVNHA